MSRKSYKILNTHIKLKILTDEESIKSGSKKETIILYIMNLSDQSHGIIEGGFITRGLKHNFGDISLNLNGTPLFVTHKRINDRVVLDKTEVFNYFNKEGYKGKIKIKAFLVDDFGNEYRSDSVILNLNNMEIKFAKFHAFNFL
ncbi:MAG: hypothetical protein HZC47_10830 [Methanobacterium sp.]|uniref:hypothetical protein n=1 Tax=Methanobacterium sp. TaxID=2164 RepID=UPI003D653689|nr:hypothetical protein [Methanobacterium sp.]